VHALVLRLLEEREDPAVIALQGAEAFEVAKSGSDKTWNARDALLGRKVEGDEVRER
jgi:hypothetical protein